jgi:hypothetical protein
MRFYDQCKFEDGMLVAPAAGHKPMAYANTSSVL